MDIHLDLSERYLRSPITLAFFMSVLLTGAEGIFDEISTFSLELLVGDFVACPRKSVEGIKPRCLKSQISTFGSV